MQLCASSCLVRLALLPALLGMFDSLPLTLPFRPHMAFPCKVSLWDILVKGDGPYPGEWSTCLVCLLFWTQAQRWQGDQDIGPRQVIAHK